MIRQPAVADRFYPGSPEALAQTIRDLSPSSSPSPAIRGIAAISPHAGYVYSGSVAAETFASVYIPPTVVILGLNHHGLGAPVALSLADWQLPLGKVSVNRRIAELMLTNESPIVNDEEAHRYEHSVEVQVPFLQALQPDLTIVPIVLSHLSYATCENIASIIADAIQTCGEDILIVASSDMTHYEPRESATYKDSQVLQQIERLDPKGVYNLVHAKRISMCGIIPVTIAMLSAKTLGAAKAKIIRYTDSGEVSGDINQVVGYAGVVIS